MTPPTPTSREATRACTGTASEHRGRAFGTTWTGPRRLQVLGLIASVLFSACKDEKLTPFTTGTVSVHVTQGSGQALPEFETLQAEVRGPRNLTLEVGPGTDVLDVRDLPPGSYDVILEGRAGGFVEGFGERTGAVVVAGETRSVDVEMAAFRPQPGSIPDSVDTPEIPVTFGAVPGAARYAVFWDRDSTFATAADTSVTSPTVILTVGDTGTYQVRAQAVRQSGAAGSPVTLGTVRVVGAPTGLGFAVEPAATQVGTTVEPAVVVELQDAFGNRLSTGTPSVTVALGANPGGATLTGTLTVAAVDGLATFEDLTIDAVGDGYTLVATAADLTGATSAPFEVTAAPPPPPAVKLVIAQQPSTVEAGSTITPAVTVAALDADDEPVPGFTGEVTVALGANPGDGTLAGTLTVAAVEGVATFQDLAIDAAGSGYTLVATAPNLADATSEPFDVTAPPPPVKLSFTQQPSTFEAGSAIAPAVTVTALDADDQPVATFTGDVSVALGANPGSGTLGGTLTVAAVNGVAAFADLTIDAAGEGYTLIATAPDLADATSASFDVTVPLPVKLAFTVQPSSLEPGATIDPAVVVTALDANDQPAPGFTGDITVALDVNLEGATLGGTLTVAAVEGVATFSDLTIDVGGWDYRMIATAQDLTDATSIPFDVAASDDPLRQVPTQADWSDPGTPVLSAGSDGEWDHTITGAASPGAVIKLNGTWLLYYIGAEGYDEDAQTPVYRSIGVATSTDGVNFTKYSGNPVITHIPNNHIEEGAVSVAAVVEGGVVHLWYGANTWVGEGEFQRPIRYRSSTDGLDFPEATDVLVRQETGRFLKPVGAFADNGTWSVYYICAGCVVGSGQGNGSLHRIHGASPTNLPNAQMVTSETFNAGGNLVPLNDDLFVVHLHKSTSDPGKYEVRWIDRSTPGTISAPIRKLDYGPFFHGVAVHRDPVSGTWRMYQHNFELDGNLEVVVEQLVVREASP